MTDSFHTPLFCKLAQHPSSSFCASFELAGDLAALRRQSASSTNPGALTHGIPEQVQATPAATGASMRLLVRTNERAADCASPETATMMRRSSSPPGSHSPLRQRRIMIANMVERARQAPSGWVSDSSSSSDDDDDVSLDGGSDDVYESYEKFSWGTVRDRA
jgi:hypothetical protein